MAAKLTLPKERDHVCDVELPSIRDLFLGLNNALPRCYRHAIYPREREP
jgi:hypothetical protein